LTCDGWFGDQHHRQAIANGLYDDDDDEVVKGIYRMDRGLTIIDNGIKPLIPKDRHLPQTPHIVYRVSVQELLPSPL